MAQRKQASSARRGYNASHKSLRRKWEQRLAQGEEVFCARCGKPIDPKGDWDLGHTEDRTAWTGPECVPCNRGAGGRNGADKVNAARRMTFRDW